MARFSELRGRLRAALLAFCYLILTLPAPAQDESAPELRVKDNPKTVYKVSFTPDGRFLASASSRNVHLWNLRTGAHEATLQGHTDSVYGLDFSPDGTLLASASADKKIILWDVASRKALRTLEGHTGRVYGVKFTPDGGRLVSCGLDDSVRVWNVSDGKLLHTFARPGSGVFAIAVSPDGRHLATTNSGEVNLWNLTGYLLEQTITAYEGPVLTVNFSSDGRLLAVGGYSQKVKLYEVETGTSAQELALSEAATYNLAFTNDGQFLLWNGSENQARLCEVATERVVRKFTTPAQQEGNISDAVFSPDERFVAGGQRGQVKIWGTIEGRLLVSLVAFDDGSSLAYTPDGYYFGTEGAAKHLAWKVGKKEYPLARFEERFARPAVIAERLR